MKRYMLVALTLSACGGSDATPNPAYKVTIEVPPARPYDPANPRRANAALRTSDGRPRLEYATGVCMGRWTSRYPSAGARLALVMDRNGSWSASGRVKDAGRWTPRGDGIVLDGKGTLGDCGKDIVHLTLGGQAYSMQRV